MTLSPSDKRTLILFSSFLLILFVLLSVSKGTDFNLTGKTGDYLLGVLGIAPKPVTLTQIAGKVYYVDNLNAGDCVGTYSIANRGCSGSDGDKYDTVQEVMALAVAGDTIYIRSGIYPVGNPRFSSSGSPGAPITISGYPGEARPALASSIGDVFIIEKSGWNNFIFKDLIIHGPGNNGILIMPPGYTRVSDIRVENVEFYDFDKSAIRVETSVERMYIKNVEVHHIYGDQGGFDFKANTTPGPNPPYQYCDGGSQFVVIQDSTFYDIDFQTASGVIAQENTNNFIYINNRYRTVNRNSFGSGGGKMFESKSGGRNIYVNNYGYGTSDAVYYLYSPHKLVAPVYVTGCGKSDHLLINNVGINSRGMNGGQSVMNKWGNANVWAYNNTFVSMNQGSQLAFPIGLNLDTAPPSPYHTGPDTAYLKNNIAYSIYNSDPNRAPGEVLTTDAQSEIPVYATGNVFSAERGDGSTSFHYQCSCTGSPCLPYPGCTTGSYSLSYFQGVTGSPNTNRWTSPGLFVSLDPANDKIAQNLRLQANSPAASAGQPYSAADPNDYPTKVQAFLAPYNGFSDFTLLSPAERQALIDLLTTAHLRDFDGAPRNTAQPSAGAYEYTGGTTPPPSPPPSPSPSPSPSPTVPPAPVSLVGHWKLDGNLIDSVSGVSGTCSGTQCPTSTTGINIGAYDFDGIDDRINTQITTDYQKITMTAWINPRNMSVDNGRIFSKGGPIEFTTATINAINVCRQWTGNTICVTSPSNSITASATMNSWQFVAMTYDGSSVSNDPLLYINGALQTTTKTGGASGSLLTNTNPYTIGLRASGGRQFNGLMDDLRIYNGVLAQSEIQALYNSVITLPSPSPSPIPQPQPPLPYPLQP